MGNFNNNIYSFLLTSPYRINVENYKDMDLYDKAKETVLFENKDVIVISKKRCVGFNMFSASKVCKNDKRTLLVNGFVPYVLQKSINRLTSEKQNYSADCVFLFKIPIGIVNFEPSRERYQVDKEIHQVIDNYINNNLRKISINESALSKNSVFGVSNSFLPMKRRTSEVQENLTWFQRAPWLVKCVSIYLLYLLVTFIFR